MNPKTAVRVLIAITLAPLMAIPAYNLREPPAREYALRLIKEKKTQRLQSLLFNADFVLAELSQLTWRLGWSIDPNKAIVGKDAWLFLGDKYAGNLSAHRQGQSVDDSRLAAKISVNLLSWERWLHQQGVRGFALVIGPDKHRVYRQYLPDWVNQGRPPRISGLVNGVASRLVCDPGPELARQSQAGLYPTYYRSDTHWNLWGAAISVDLLRHTLEGQGLKLSWQMPDPVATGLINKRSGGDLAGFLRIPAPIEEPDPLPLVYNTNHIQSVIRDLNTNEVLHADGYGQLQFPRQIVHVVTKGAANPLKVLWLRDSFGIGQSPLFSAHFEETIQIHWGWALGDKAEKLVELVRDHRPDIVIMTIVERAVMSDLLLTPPPQN